MTVGKDGKATGVAFIDKTTGKEARGQGQGRRAGGRRVRDRPHHAQFQEQRLPQRHRQLQRPGRQVHHGHRRHEPRRPHPGPGGPPAAQRGRRRRRPLLLPLVALQGAEGRQARLRPRLPHRDGRLAPHARRRQPGARRTSPRAATAPSSRKTPAATTARSSASPPAAR